MKSKRFEYIRFVKNYWSFLQVLRYLILTFSIFFLQFSGLLQTLIQIGVSYAFVKISIDCQPYRMQGVNALNIINQFSIFILSYMEWPLIGNVDNMRHLYNIGWAIIFFFTAILLINLAMVISVINYDLIIKNICLKTKVKKNVGEVYLEKSSSRLFQIVNNIKDLQTIQELDNEDIEDNLGQTQHPQTPPFKINQGYDQEAQPILRKITRNISGSTDLRMTPQEEIDLKEKRKTKIVIRRRRKKNSSVIASSEQDYQELDNDIDTYGYYQQRK
ncbi:UNKNOWN [Stylonychia lemnae]|uniref:Uncharacterized protein n=1 Tax=Stylonychia lemnae TaxID=5949 RepID=A0A078AUM7_STYLE|nr:UNKNOWN [Stylonychia lemnae]|eukprot:CDW84937.1 UNKNOWN [Stylonychia lemnae]